MIESGHPFQGTVFDFIDVFPWSLQPDHFCLEQTDDGLRQSVVVRVANTARRRRYAGF